MKSLSWLRLLALSSFGFALTLYTNTLDPGLYGHKILQLAPNNPNTLLGITTAAGSALVILLAPIVGSLSDRTRSRLGQRLPYFLAGVPVMIVAILGVGLAPTIAVFVLSVLLYRFGDNLIFTPWLALYPDAVPPHQRGLASGVKSFVDILAVLIGRLVAGELLSRTPQWGSTAVWATMTVPMAVLLLAALVTWLAMHGLPRVRGAGKTEKLWATYRVSFHFDWRKQKDFTWWLINRFFFWTAFIILSTFLLLFVIDVIGLPEADAQRYLGRLSLVLGGAILLVAVPAGRLADRWGRKPLVVFACALASLGTLLVLFIRDTNWLFLAGGMIGIGAGIYLSANFAQLTDIVPVKEAGRFLGLANIAGAAGGALGRLLGGLLIDPLNRLSGDHATGYISMYALAAVLFAASAWAGWKTPEIKRG